MAWWEQLVAVVTGGGITIAANALLDQSRSRGRHREALREAYVEFMASVESISGAAAQIKDGHERRLVAHTRLKILERDATTRAMTQAVWDAIPEYPSEEHHEWEEMKGSLPGADWPPLRKAMNALQERLREHLRY